MSTTRDPSRVGFLRGTRWCVVWLACLAVAIAARPAWADGDDELGESLNVTLLGGGAVSEGVGVSQRQSMPTTGSITLSGIPVGATVFHAFLYWITIGDPGDDTAELDGVPVLGTLIGTTEDTCWAYGDNRTYRADVTSLVPGNGTYDVGGLTWIDTVLDGHGFSIVAVYGDPAATEWGTVVIHDGGQRVDNQLSNFDITGFSIDEPPTSAAVRFLVGDGQAANDNCILFEGNCLATNVFNASDGDMWDDLTFGVTALVSQGMTSVEVDPSEFDYGSDCLAAAAVVFDVQFPLSCLTDDDGDGYLDAACGGDDCDDGDADVNPGAAEDCNGVDDDCDGDVDEGYDGDGDGSTTCDGDCDDGDPDTYPAAPEICDGVDNDCDGLVPADEVDADGDGHMVCDNDCDDDDPDVHPGHAEICDGLDNNCNGTVPNAEVDGDGDGFVDCGPWVGVDPSILGGDDCDDNDGSTYPGAPEICDGLDNDCDGAVPGGEIDDDGDGLVECDGDCDDGDPDVGDGLPELCDGLDNDCDGLLPTDEVDWDADGFLECAECDDLDASVYPGAPEICDDGVDSDCAGDLGDTEVDDDGDGFSECGGDCDDADAATHPAAEEICNSGHDDDCDPTTDELLDDDGDGFSECDGDCADGDATVFPGTLESCNGVDDDCDGLVDEEIDYDLDGSFGCGGDDCDDYNAYVYPGAPEVPYNGVDEDCDGDDLTDVDGDGYDGGPLGDDCADTDAAINPGIAEDCANGVDDDCDGDTDGDDADCASDDDTVSSSSGSGHPASSRLRAPIMMEKRVAQFMIPPDHPQCGPEHTPHMTSAFSIPHGGQNGPSRIRTLLDSSHSTWSSSPWAVWSTITRMRTASGSNSTGNSPESSPAATGSGR